jgi:hypothetical protein
MRDHRHPGGLRRRAPTEQPRRGLGVPLRLGTMLLAMSQIRAACTYSPPPVLAHGQGADTMGNGNMALGAEAGWGAAGSWWKAKNLGDPEVNTGAIGAARLRFALGDAVDVGVVGGLGPESALVLGPEVKWRFAHLAPSDAAGNAPGFHAALISGFGIGAADYRYGPEPRRHVFLAPYTGVLASGGIRVVQMFTGLRFAASETLGNERPDLTLYPVLAYGVELRPFPRWAFYAEADLAGGITTTDVHDTALMGSVTAGMSVTFDQPWFSTNRQSR